MKYRNVVLNDTITYSKAQKYLPTALNGITGRSGQMVSLGMPVSHSNRAGSTLGRGCAGGRTACTREPLLVSLLTHFPSVCTTTIPFFSQTHQSQRLSSLRY